MNTRTRMAQEAPPLPHSAEGERAVLGAVILNNDMFMRALQKLDVADFYLPQHQRVFASMERLVTAETAIDSITLVEDMRRAGDLTSSEEAVYVGGIADGLPRATNIDFYCDIVKQKSLLRSLAYSAGAIQEQALAATDDAGTILDRADMMMRQLRDAAQTVAETRLGSVSTAELFAAQDTEIEWLAWPFAAVGLTSITDALPKVGKTRMLLEGIHASRLDQTFLGFATRPMRVIYVSEQSQASLALQAREVGFTGAEPIEELRWITREFWSRFIFPEFLEKLEKQLIQGARYNTLIFDCWHTIARLEDEKDASEVNRLGNFTIDVAARNKLALALGRHDRKSGGDVGVSGRSSIQLSGLVDVILHLVSIRNKPTQRRLELLGRVPGLPAEQLIDLVDGRYINFGQPEPAPDTTAERIARVGEWLDEYPHLTGEEIQARFAASVPPFQISIATAKRYRAEAMK